MFMMGFVYVSIAILGVLALVKTFGPIIKDTIGSIIKVLTPILKWTMAAVGLIFEGIGQVFGAFFGDGTFEDAIDVTDNLSIQTDGTTLFPGATFTQTGNNPVTGTFCWTVVPGNTGNVVTFIVQDDGCPVMGTSGFGVNIDIITGVYAGPDASVCGSVPVQLNAIGGASFTWAPATGLSCTNCPNPVANPAVSTLYTVTSNLSGSCSNTDQNRRAQCTKGNRCALNDHP